MRVLLFLFLFCSPIHSQISVLVLGNHSSLCLGEQQNFIKQELLPQNLSSYNAIMLFSGASSKLNEEDVERIIQFVNEGGGLYSGAEDWPLQAESNQVTKRIYKKESFGRYEQEQAESPKNPGNLNLQESESIPAGVSTVAFPMDYRLKVEAWVGDQPLLLTGEVEKGRIVIDGGYSRFYCNQRSGESDKILNKILNYLIQKDQ